MDMAHPYAVLSHRLDAAAASVLSRTTRPLTGREVARLAPEGTQPGIAKALRRLVEHGLVERAEAGRSALYTMNRDHLAAPAAQILAGMRADLFDRIRTTVESWAIAPIHLSVFGSAARGDGDTESDVDLFVVLPAGVDREDASWASQVDSLAEAIDRWTGNRAGISQVSPSDVSRLARERPPVVEELETDGITLVGRDVRALFRNLE